MTSSERVLAPFDHPEPWDFKFVIRRYLNTWVGQNQTARGRP
jgi:hypothetical protein